MNELITIDKISEVNFRLNYPDFGTGLELKSYFSCYAPDYKYHPKFRAKMWNGKISFFSMMDRTIPIGLLPMLLKFCDSYGYDYKFDFDVNEMSTDIKMEDVEKFTSILMKDQDKELYDYQLDSVHRAIANKRGVILSPTGSGKSLVIYSIVRFLIATDKKVLLVVPSISLVEQMYSDFEEYGWKNVYNSVSKLHNKIKPDFRKDVLITTWQSIVNRKGPFFEKYGALLIDETHGAKSKSIQSISKKCVNADFRLGFTGTLPSEEADTLNIQGSIGPVIFRQKSKELIDRGILSKIAIANLILKYPDKISKRNLRRPYPEEVDTIINYEKRNEALKYVFDCVKDGQNVLILCKLIDHIKNLESFLKENLGDKFDIRSIYGKIPAKEREEIRNEIEYSGTIVKQIKMYFGDKEILFGETDLVELSSGIFKKAKEITCDDDISDVFLKKYL